MKGIQPETAEHAAESHEPKRRGRPRQGAAESSPVAQLIFNHIGPTKTVGTLKKFREVVGVGTQQLRDLRTAPDKLSKEVLVRMADAVKLDPLAVLKLAGHVGSKEEDVNRIRVESYKLRAASFADRWPRLPVVEFFERIAGRAPNWRFFQGVSFAGRSLQLNAPNAQAETAHLLAKGMCYAIYVPIVADRDPETKEVAFPGLGFLNLRCRLALFDACDLARRLMEFFDAGDDRNKIRDRIAVFVLNGEKVRPDASRVLIPHDDYERKFLIGFDTHGKSIAETRVVAKWVRGPSSPDDDRVHILYDNELKSAGADDFDSLQQLEEYFSFALGLWSKQGNGQRFGEVNDPPGLWIRLPLEAMQGVP